MPYEDGAYNIFRIVIVYCDVSVVWIPSAKSLTDKYTDEEESAEIFGQ